MADTIELVDRGERQHAFKVLQRALEAFVFRLGHRHRSATLTVREGFVTDDFVDLAPRRRPGAAPRRAQARDGQPGPRPWRRRGLRRRSRRPMIADAPRRW